jgi:hypothetical protein
MFRHKRGATVYSPSSTTKLEAVATVAAALLIVAVPPAALAAVQRQQALPARVVWDSYRRLIQMCGKTVPGIDSEQSEHALDSAKKARGAVARGGSDTR